MNHIFEELYQEESESLVRALQGFFDIDDIFDFFSGKFFKKDHRLTDIVLPEVSMKIGDQAFQKQVIALTNEQYKRERLILVERKKYLKDHEVHDPINDAKLELIEREIAQISYPRIIEGYRNIFQSVWKDIVPIQVDIEFFENNHTSFCIAKLLYEDYKIRKDVRFEVPENNRLLKLYKDYGIDLEKSDEQYNNYKLLTIDENFEIIRGNIPKVFDKRLSTHLIINEIPSEVLALLVQLVDDKSIKSLALRPEYNIVGKGIENRSYAMEEVERGKIFSFKDLKSPIINKLFSTDDYSNLWIKIDGKNITFEELIDDFHVEGESIVTQVLHLEYFNEGDVNYINHIDHEYIFYSADEYSKRLTDHKVKGTNRPRFKTFKVDKSKIPFYLDGGSFFLYVVLESYFKKKELLTEYFECVVNVI